MTFAAYCKRNLLSSSLLYLYMLVAFASPRRLKVVKSFISICQ